MCLLNFGLFNIAVYLPIKSIEIGGEDANTALAVSLSSATDTLARILLCTVLWDSKRFRGIYTRQMGFVIAMAGAGVLMSLAAVVDQQWSFLVWSAATGFFIGGALSPTFVMMKQIAGADAFADSLAVDFLLEGPVTFVAPILLENYGYTEWKEPFLRAMKVLSHVIHWNYNLVT
ncbi:PREDICTED: uncharacterized protein LOC106810303 [Priapulus caudatus]|uniref:Uncharacterized protein LOC106810303 n=1 Tax=Priapulus caudatus TaxID=37621 RepID=A0ABM1EA72_PRICU|nr:PREDICTED: uncharacterized protein LOC106810303 [Priapulus caudatus]